MKVFVVKTVFRNQWWWQFFFPGGHYQIGCQILPIFKCFIDFNESWFIRETWYPELIGDEHFFFRAAIFKMAANFYRFLAHLTFPLKLLNQMFWNLTWLFLRVLWTKLLVKTVFQDQWWWQFYFLGDHFQNGCRILPIFKCFFDFNEIWFIRETWYPELIGDDKTNFANQ